MAWHELQLIGLPRSSVEAASRLLFALGTAGVQEDHLPGEAPPPRQPWDDGPPPPPPPRVLLRAWFDDPDRAAIGAELDAFGGERHWAEVPDEDWSTSWRDAFAPVHISDTLVVAPSWCAPPGALVIEPGQGFGTGQHPTTRQLLGLLEPLVDAHAPCTALDIGCGSGVLALAAARLGLSAHGVDVEAEAVADARRNAARNQPLPGSATFTTTPVAQLEEPADLVFANLHAELLVSLAPDLVRLCAGHLLAAGILDDREALVHEALADLVVEQRVVEGRWIALHLRRT